VWRRVMHLDDAGERSAITNRMTSQFMCKPAVISVLLQFHRVKRCGGGEVHGSRMTDCNDEFRRGRGRNMTKSETA
jgi:hypothetical protein